MDRLLLRAGLVYLALPSLLIGLYGTIAPRSFYDSFPLGLNWVANLPPYNEHLTTDTTGFFLAFGVLFAWAAISLQRALIVPLLVAWSVAATAHLAFHVTHLDAFSAGDAIAQTALLATLLLVPGGLLLAERSVLRS